MTDETIPTDLADALWRLREARLEVDGAVTRVLLALGPRDPLLARLRRLDAALQKRIGTLRRLQDRGGHAPPVEEVPA